MKIDLSCPVELWQYAMPSEEHNDCSFIMNNLSEKTVTSVQITLDCYGKENEPIFRQTERIQGLRAVPHEQFTVSVIPDRWEDVEGLDLIIEKVWFDDSTVWRKNEKQELTQYQSNALSSGRALDQLRFVAGPDAVGFPTVQKEVWLCVCGRPNVLSAIQCCRCSRRREMVFTSLSRENVERLNALHESKLTESAKKARQKNNILQLNREKEQARRHRLRKKAVRWGITLMLVAAATAAFFVWGYPAVKYQAALNSMNKGNTVDARAIFSGMPEYRNSAQMLLECDYQDAIVLQSRGDAESLEMARVAYEQLGDYADSAEKHQQTIYSLGELYLKDGLYEAAAERFLELGEYSDSAQRYQESVYEQAAALMTSGNDENAQILFDLIPDFRDAETQSMECGYRIGMKAVQEENWEAALSAFEGLSGYSDVDEQTQKATYQLAMERLENEGDYEAAGELFIAAGDYLDAEHKGYECLYLQAKMEEEAQKYDKAITLYTAAQGFEDAEERIDLCRQTLARAAMEQGDYAAAVAWYGDIGEADTVSQASKLILQECHLKLAEKEKEAGNNEAAEAELANAVAFGAADKELNVLRYDLAEAAYADGRYDQALERYVLLGTYKNSVVRAKQCRYAMAENAVASGDYAAAIDLYTELGNYKNSRILLEDTMCSLALQKQEAGDLEAAEELLASLTSARAKNALAEIRRTRAGAMMEAGDFEGAAQQYAAIAGAENEYKGAVYAQANALQETGDSLAAGELFASLGKYEDAQDRSAACYANVFGDAAETARSAFAAEDYAAVVAALEPLDMTALKKAYPDLPDMYTEASYLCAEGLYAAGKPYEALPYYQRAGDYQKSDSDKLERRVYLILGEWKSASGVRAEFRADSTCTIGNEELYFRVNNFSVYTGTTPDAMTLTHKLTSITQKGMTLRDIRDGRDDVYKYTRVGEWSLPVADLPSEEVKNTVEEPAEEVIEEMTEETVEEPVENVPEQPAGEDPEAVEEMAPVEDNK